MTRDSFPQSFPHESAEFLPRPGQRLPWPLTAGAKRGYGQLSESHSTFFCVCVCVSLHLIFRGRQFERGGTDHTHRPTLQSKGALWRKFLNGNMKPGAGSCEPNQPINGHSSLLAVCMGVLCGSDRAVMGTRCQRKGFVLAGDVDLLNSNSVCICQSKEKMRLISLTHNKISSYKIRAMLVIKEMPHNSFPKGPRLCTC